MESRTGLFGRRGSLRSPTSGKSSVRGSVWFNLKVFVRSGNINLFLSKYAD